MKTTLFNSKMKLIIVTLFVVHFFVLQTFSQTDKVRLAQSYEQQGDFANSYRLYSQLLDSEPLNTSYFLGIVRSLNNQQKYTELLPIAETQVKRAPSSVTYSIAAETYWKMGQSAKADEFWNIGVQEFCFSELDYSIIAKSQLGQRQLEKAITTYLAAREKLKSKDIFADELSQCYAAVGNVELSMNEIINLLFKNNNLGVVQGKITALLTNQNSIVTVENSLVELKNKDVSNLLNYRLLEWFYRSTNQMNKALQIVSELDKKSGSNGSEILQFATVSSLDGNYNDALSAYSLLIDNNSVPAYIRVAAIFGYTKTLETKLSHSSSISKEQISEVILRYDNILNDPTASAFAPEIHYRKGIVLKTFDKNLELAKKEFLICITKYNGSNFASIARIELAEISIQENIFVEAKKLLQPLFLLPEKNDLRRKADFLLAEMFWFNGEVDTAKSVYSIIAKRVNTNEANDALERIILIEQFQDQKSRLQKYAKAEFLTYQQKLEDAISAFKTILVENSSDDITELSYLSLNDLYFKVNQVDKIIILYSEFEAKFPESIWGDKLLFNYALALKKSQRIEESKSAFQLLLSKYPASIYLSATREELKKIIL